MILLKIPTFPCSYFLKIKLIHHGASIIFLALLFSKV